ncbi:MAG TPA: hypothetical protein PL059_08440 [Spirochaetota bacterium]|nr:hypothetical protein [Spirochaetota bacterium]HOM09933.1 hypothetical protein [Spirochaetota bacterium]HPP48628.1 hypothetical protein [Spirochaetota bacterium]
MASLLVSLLLMLQSFETAQPLALNVWAIAPAYQANPSPLISGVTYANPFGYPDLYRTTTFIHTAMHGYSVGLQWQYFGIPEYREDTLNVGACWAIAQWISVGVEFHDYILSIHTETFSHTQSLYDYGMYCTIKPFERVSLFVMQNNIKNFHDDGYIPSETILSARAEFFKGCTVEYEFHYGDYISQIVKINGYITRYCAVDIGYSRELNLSSAGITILWGSFLIRYEMNHHSFLGNTHTFGLVFSQVGFSYISADKPVKKEKPKLDIQSCTAEELIELNVVSEVLCQRIIKYRKMFGNVSVTSLYQLGLTTQQIRDLQQYTYNYYEDETNGIQNHEKQSSIKQNNYIPHEEKNRRIKILFQSMVAAEIPAYIAISLAEEYQKSGEKGVLHSPLFKNLTPSQQKSVKTTCGIQ